MVYRGTSLTNWKVNYEPVKERYKSGVEELHSGNMVGFVKLLYSRTFNPDNSGDQQARKGLHNDLLGLSKENLDEYPKIAVEMTAKSN